jgi:hypothetical protein
MALKLITHGITIVSAKGPDAAPVALAQAGPGTQSVDIGVGPRGGGYPTVTTRIRANGTEGSGAETDVEVPLSSLPVDRRRGWSELPCDLPNTLVYILYGEQGDTVIYLHSPNPADWMAGLPDSARLSEIAIPGSHESTALHGCE